jgi:hypothetical protein
MSISAPIRSKTVFETQEFSDSFSSSRASLCQNQMKCFLLGSFFVAKTPGLFLERKYLVLDVETTVSKQSGYVGY